MDMAFVDLTWYSLETGKEVSRVPLKDFKYITPYELRQIFGDPVASCVYAVTPEHIDTIRENWLPNQKFEFDKYGYEIEYALSTIIEGKKGRQKIYF